MVKLKEQIESKSSSLEKNNKAKILVMTLGSEMYKSPILKYQTKNINAPSKLVNLCFLYKVSKFPQTAANVETNVKNSHSMLYQCLEI